MQAPHYGYLMELAETTIPYCPSPANGDVNGDMVVNGLDITAFVDLVLNNTYGPASSAFCAANIQNDASLDMTDVNLFVAALMDL